MSNTQMVQRIGYYMVLFFWIVNKSSAILNIFTIKFISKYSTSYPVSTFHNDMLDVVQSESIGSR